jgi:molybdopterin biosynthesis enzyme
LESDNLPGNALDALAVCNTTLQPNIRKLLQILATLPVSTCTSERSFSTLRRMKTYLRNSTSETRLNGLALLNIHREHTPTPNAIIDELLKKKRRLDFVL